MKLSIIIPIYNKAHWLRRCLDSIRNSKVTNFECICIDDCSTDNSRDIINEYCRLDFRFKAIFLSKNIGVSAVRNKGLDIAKGEWIGFVDADDYIRPTRFSDAIAWAELNDAPICGCAMTLRGHRRKYKNKPHTNHNIVYSVKRHLYLRIDMASVNNVVYKKTLIGDVRFRDCSYAEDLIFNEELMPKLTRVPWCNQELYVADCRASELSHGPSKDRINKSIQCWKQMLNDTNHPYRFRLSLSFCLRRYFRSNWLRKV